MASSTSELIIAIDFGTTFTGVAFAHSGVVSVYDRNAAKVAANVDVVRNWPGTNSQFAEKTPTVIAYTKPDLTWGGKVKNHHEPQVLKFKLGLEPNLPRHLMEKRVKDKSTDRGRGKNKAKNGTFREIQDKT